jgi:predicted porin
MQKKLLSAAIGAALAGPAFMAQADVTVYGQAQVEWAQVTNDSNYAFGSTTSAYGSWNNNTVPGNSEQGALLDNKRGRFGIKADEDLGNGWKGIAKFEFQVDTADGTDGTPISDRISVVGISQKSIGTLRFGQDHSPYKASGVAMDPFVATSLEARNNYGMSGNRDGWGVGNAHNSFWDNSLFFNSASWAGVYVNLALGLDSTGANTGCASRVLPGFNTPNCNAPNGAENNGDLDVLVGWKGDLGPVKLNVFGDYLKLANSNNVDDPTATKLGVQVTVAKAHTISFQYEMTDRTDIVTNAIDEADYLFLGYQGKFGPVTAVAQFGQFNSGDVAGYNFEGQYYTLGAIYNMSKTFRVFGGYRKTTLDVNVGIAIPIRDESVLSIGLRKDF